MDRVLLLIGVFVAYAFSKNAKAGETGTDKNASLYSRFIARKNQGIGKRGNWQFIYTNEIYFLISPYLPTTKSGITDPLLFSVYEQCENLILLAEQNKAFQPVVSNWVKNYLKVVPLSVVDDIKFYENKLFKVSQITWNGKPLV